MTVPVLLDGQGPYPFVVDTGSDRTVISRELASSLKLSPGDPVRMNDTAGVGMTPTAVISDLAVGTRKLREVNAPALLAANLGAVGMLGSDGLHDQRVLMDFTHSRMTVEASKPDVYGPDVVVVRARRKLGQLVIADASIDGQPILVIVDTGAECSIGNAALRALVHERQAGPTVLSDQLISVSGHIVPAQLGMLHMVKIGGFYLDNLPVAFADIHTFREFDLTDQPAMLLGMDALRHFKQVAVDFRRKEVSFRLPSGA